MRWQSRRPRTRWISLFSGLKSSVLQFQARCARRQENFVPADLACSFQETALEALLSRVTYALDHVSGIRHFVVAGGVAANSRLRTLITETIAPNYPQIRFTIPPLSCCTDNAADDRDRRYDRLSAWPPQQF